MRDYHERQYAVTQTAVAHQDQLAGLDGQHPGGPAGQEPGGELSGLLHHTTGTLTSEKNIAKTNMITFIVYILS